MSGSVAARSGLRPGPLLAAAECAAARVDAEASAWLAPYRFRWLLAAFLWLTTLGIGAALIGVVVAATGLLWMDGRRTKLILPLWIAFAGAQASVWISKLRDRACPAGLPRWRRSRGLAVLPERAHNRRGCDARLRRLRGGQRFFDPAPPPRSRVCAAVLVALIGFSRVFLGVHFATDVVGGILVGGAWLLAGIALARQRERSIEALDRPGLPSSISPGGNDCGRV